MFRAYFFDAEAGEVAPIRIRKASASEDVRHLIGCAQTDSVSLADEHVVICDESGLANGLVSVTQIEGVETPLGGNLVIAGLSDGQLTDPTLTIEEVAARIDVMRPLLDMQESPPTSPVASQFKIRLVSQKPRVINSKAAHLKLVR